MAYAEHQAQEFGYKTLIDCARRGTLTLPNDLMDAYTEFEETSESMNGRGKVRDEAKLDAQYMKLMRVFNMTGAETLIKEHVQPALATYVEGFIADTKILGKYANELNIPLAVVSETDKVREAYVRWAESHPHYHGIRACWEVLVIKSGGIQDPNGIKSPLAEVRNMPELVPNWDACFHWRADWPWSNNCHWIKFAWIVNNGGQPWCPTAAELNNSWARYRSSGKAA